MKQAKVEEEKKNIALLLYSTAGELDTLKSDSYNFEVHYIGQDTTSEAYSRILKETKAETVLLADTTRIPVSAFNEIISLYLKEKRHDCLYHIGASAKNRFLRFLTKFSLDKEVLYSPVLIGSLLHFQKAYTGAELCENPVIAIAYSLQKNYVSFRKLEHAAVKISPVSQTLNLRKTAWKYTVTIPFRYLFSGYFFRNLLVREEKVKRNMVFRMLLMAFALFTFFYMPYISKDYGISGDECQYYEHAGYIWDYYLHHDQSIAKPSQRYLQFYGIIVHTVTAGICRLFNIENYHEFRHAACAFIGAGGIWYTGLLGLRLGGGLCGLLSILLMFFTPRFFGHSMNNLTDLPFAVGFVISLYYSVRLFDYYPKFRTRDVFGMVLGITLALGTRSGGLIIYPMLLMYGGLFYIRYYGVREFYKFSKYRSAVIRIFEVLLLAGIGGYLCSILLWPFAMAKPFSNVLVSLKEFTNFTIGLRTIFEGRQMMSNMLPWQYAPEYLMIGMPLVVLVGFGAYLVLMLIKRKQFTLPVYFLLFAVIFPVFWVIYKNSNLYGGIRHLLFVMPPMVVLSAKGWSYFMEFGKKYVKIIIAFLFLGSLALPMIHMVKNHPNDYVYFNELIGGVKGAYGDYETDYYYNSLKKSANWFKKHVELPTDRKTIIMTNHLAIMSYYFRNDTNIIVRYSRYYEKYSKDWDYAIFGNVYISRFQLQHGLFPPEGVLYAPEADGHPMSVVLKRQTKDDLKGFNFEKEGKIGEAIQALESYTRHYKKNEEAWSRLGKLYYMTGQFQKSDSCLQNALALHPSLNEALYMSALLHLQQKDYNQAYKDAQKILSENSSSVDGYYLRALVHFNRKNYKESINDLNRALSLRSNYERALVLAADIMRITGNFKQAISIYDRLLKIRKDPANMVQMADTYCRLKNFKQADALLLEVDRIQPGYFPRYKVLIRMLLMQGQWQDAGKLLTQFNQVNNDADLFILRAMYFQGVNQMDQARAMIGYALKLQPDNPEALDYEKKWQGPALTVK